MYDRGVAILFPTVFLYPDPFSTIEQNFHIFPRVSQYAMNPCLDTRYKRTLCLLRYGIVGQRLFSGSINKLFAPSTLGNPMYELLASHKK